MKLSEQWLREYGQIKLSLEALESMLPMAGLELDSVLPVEGDSDDHILELDITPNRGDCLSVLGLSREIAALQNIAFTAPNIKKIPETIKDTFPVTLTNSQACPRYVGRVIRNVDLKKPSPAWMQERLKRSGINSIDAVVDVTNFVMLELGQPLHAFDLAKLKKGIQVRNAKNGESLTLLNGQTITLTEECLLITDGSGPLALAGIMGGEGSGISETTVDVFLESAYFTPEAIAGRARRFGLSTDSSHRYERGVDPLLQERAIERASALLLEIVGGSAGPVVVEGVPEFAANIITLRPSRLLRVLGIFIPDDDVVAILQALGMTVFAEGDAWIVQVPSYRFDLRIEEDLIEEVARVYGYHKIPTELSRVALEMPMIMEDHISKEQFSDQLVALGYQEVITYSFVSPKIQQMIMPHAKGKLLQNPISPDLSEMRTSLWPGLLNAVLYNQHRQTLRVKLFEMGLRFWPEGADRYTQDRMISGVIAISPYATQWGQTQRDVDFYDLKADVVSLLQMTGCEDEFIFETGAHPALHPGQSAQIVRQGQVVGQLGLLHPQLLRELDLKGPIALFEIKVDGASSAIVPTFKPITKFPAVRRDLACVVPVEVSSAVLVSTIRQQAGEKLQQVDVFDVYQGAGLPTGTKSIALGLTLQDFSRTLLDEEINHIMDTIVAGLAAKGIKLRERT